MIFLCLFRVISGLNLVGLCDESENIMDIKSVNASPVPSVPARSAEAFSSTPSSAPVVARPVDDSIVAPALAVAPAAQSQEAEQRLNDSVKTINETFKTINSSVRFSVDPDTQRQVVKVMDMDTDTVIRQFPSEEVLSIAKALDKLQGLLIKDKA